MRPDQDLASVFESMKLFFTDIFPPSIFPEISGNFDGPSVNFLPSDLPGAKSFLFVGLVLDCVFIVAYPAGFDPA